MAFGRLLPREGNVFELFNEHRQHSAGGARAFLAMVQGYGNPTERERHVYAVVASERAAGKITAEVHRLLHRTFITPLDRDRIHRLINATQRDHAHQHRGDLRRRFGAQRLGGAPGLAGHIVMAWIVTIPATALIAAVFYGLGTLLF